MRGETSRCAASSPHRQRRAEAGAGPLQEAVPFAVVRAGRRRVLRLATFAVRRQHHVPREQGRVGRSVALPDEVYVVAGTFDDGAGSHPAGTFLHAPAGSWHVPASVTGCTLFLFHPEG
ncbi:cupin domain-containing protein [Amycolatopsis tolypomycina]|uniref:cupin domain-containing protein n=1 Tax=Amycolatopsis tolypomycina TaxID=208445 RepID=UPI001FC9D77D|nr:cupin domain-containing protein [Amycolatopsis tolypomycina]